MPFNAPGHSGRCSILLDAFCARQFKMMSIVVQNNNERERGVPLWENLHPNTKESGWTGVGRICITQRSHSILEAAPFLMDKP